jgi:hypothetical protein
MANITSKITLTSTNTFPSPINFSLTAAETVAGTHSSFVTNIIEADTTETIFSSTGVSGNTQVLYFYVESASANSSTDPIVLSLEDILEGTELNIIRLYPGDFAYLPVSASGTSGILIKANNTAAASTAKLSYFYGERG